MPSSSAGVATTGLRALLLFAVLLLCFGVLLMLYLSYLVQDDILHLCTTASGMGLYLTYSCGWGVLFACKDPMEKEAKAGLVAAYSCSFLSMGRIDFLYILLSSFLFSLPSLSSPPSQCKSESPPLCVFI